MKNSNSNSYDDVFRTLITSSPEILIPFVNEMFKPNKKFSKHDKIQYNSGDLFIPNKKGKRHRITDSSFTINSNNIDYHYHIECQSRQDSSMIIRMYEYDSQLALRDGEISNQTLTVRFPNSGILYLRSSQAVPDTMTIRIITPGGNTKYVVNILKLNDYNVDELFNKELYFLIPFILFNCETELKMYNEDEVALKKFLNDFENVIDRLRRCLTTGKIDDITYRTIIETMYIVNTKITDNYKHVQKEVEEIMGGKEIELEVRKVYNEGYDNGYDKGQKEVLIKLVESGKITKKEASEIKKTLTPESSWTSRRFK